MASTASREPGEPELAEVDEGIVRERTQAEGLFKRMVRRDRLASALLPTAFLLAFLVIWQWLSTSGVVDEILVPAPTDVIDAFGRLLNTWFFWDATWVTAQEALLGFVFGVLAAWILGTLIGLFPIVNRAIFPIVVAIEIVPRVALAPVFLSWFGFGIASKIVMAAAICFFPVLINVVLGLENVSKDARTLMRSFGASKWEEYRKLLLPASLPAIFASLKVAITFALTGAIVAEFVGANEGLGVLIRTFNFQLLVAEGFACILALSIMGLVFYGLTMLLESRIVFWRGH
jgi:NitT/TauT family transport system permease protein